MTRALGIRMLQHQSAPWHASSASFHKVQNRYALAPASPNPPNWTAKKHLVVVSPTRVAVHTRSAENAQPPWLTRA